MSSRIKIYEYILNPADNGSHFGELLLEDYNQLDIDGIKFCGLTQSVLQTDPDNKDAQQIDYPEENGYRILVNPNLKSYTYIFTLTCILNKSFNKNEINKIVVEQIQRKLRNKPIAVFNIYRQQMIVGYILKAFNISKSYKVEIGADYRDMIDLQVTVEVNNPDLCNLLNINDLPTP